MYVHWIQVVDVCNGPSYCNTCVWKSSSCWCEEQLWLDVGVGTIIECLDDTGSASLDDRRYATLGVCTLLTHGYQNLDIHWPTRGPFPHIDVSSDDIYEQHIQAHADIQASSRISYNFSNLGLVFSRVAFNEAATSAVCRAALFHTAVYRSPSSVL